MSLYQDKNDRLLALLIAHIAMNEYDVHLGVNPKLADVPNVGFDNHLRTFTDDEVMQYLDRQGMDSRLMRKLDDGDWVALVPLAFSTSVCAGVGKATMFTYRWCFSDPKMAVQFFCEMTDVDSLPTDEQKAHLVGHRYLDKPLYMAYDELGFQKW